MLTKKDFFIDSLREFILQAPINTPSCDCCGYLISYARMTIKSIEGVQTVNLCNECSTVVERNEFNFEVLSTEEVY